MQEIKTKITGVQQVGKAPVVELVPKTLHEGIQRPETLSGTTYKIKTPIYDNALYVTINDIILNPGTEHEERRPFEIFINSKAMADFQWIVALTRIVSAVFRKGGEVTFLVEELRSVFNPNGGYFKQGRYVPSLVAEIGDIVERHLKFLGMITDADPPLEKKAVATAGATQGAICKRCGSPSVVNSGGCDVCMNCGDSKCG